MLPTVAAINAARARDPGPDRRPSCAPRPPSSSEQLAAGRHPRRPPGRRPSPWPARRRAAPSACATSTSSSSAAWSSTTGKIAEMKTGEGKTLVATLPVYLNALAGKGVHVVTVNDYLARRDADWMGAIYRFLGLTVGVIQHDLPDAERKAAYGCDITYGTNNEFGFDYLRDNMKFDARVDGAARPPLRDRRRGRLDPDRRGAHAAHHLRPVRGVDRQVLPIDRIIPRLERGEEIEDKRRQQAAPPATSWSTRRRTPVSLTEEGVEKVEKLLGIEQPLRPGEHGDAPRRQPGRCARTPLQARRRLPGQGRRGGHRRRVHRPHDAGPALVGRPAPGGRGQGRRQDRAREPDPRHDHLPELLPHVREARRHDRHGRHRGGRVRRRSTSSTSWSSPPTGR